MSYKMDFVAWFRSVAPYINGFRNKTFVIAFGGEVIVEGMFVEFVHDLNLLASLGVRLVLVHGARPQIESRLRERRLKTQYVKGMRVTDAESLQCVKESIGRVRVEIESLLSMGLPNSPMANAAIRVASGNFVTARPVGVIDGIDLMHTGEVRKIDTTAIRARLEQGELVLLSPLGYSPTGEIFNLTLENVAAEAAIALKAEKLIFLMDGPGIETKHASGSEGSLIRELTVMQGKAISAGYENEFTEEGGDAQVYLPFAVHACESGVPRAHLISRHIDGALLQELFTHSGIGTMISEGPLEAFRDAEIDDVGAILQLIEPLEADGTLVRRSRELLEMEIDRFVVIEHDKIIIGCAALYPFADEGAAELACLAVHPEYRSTGCGEALLRNIEARAEAHGITNLFVLTTRAAHWFVERGFREACIDDLPKARQGLYNYRRRSKVFLKKL